MYNIKNNTVSIAMCVHNEEKDLPDCLESLTKQKFKLSEIIIVDDGSTDRTISIIEEYSNILPIKLIKVSPMPLRPARKISVESVKGEIVITVDADTILNEKCVEKIVEKFQDEKVAAVGGNIMVYGEGDISDGVKILNHYFNLRRKKKDGQIDWITGCCAAYRRNILEGAGGLREDEAGEDVEISWRLNKLGWKVIQAEDAIVYHKVPIKLKDVFNKSIEGGRRSVHTYLAHKEKLRSLNFLLRFFPIALIPLTILDLYLPAIIFFISASIFYYFLGYINASIKIRTYAFIILLVMNIGWCIGLFSELIIQIIRKIELVLEKPWK